MRIAILTALIFFSAASNAQDWLTKALGDAGAESKAKLDSVDFQFAISGIKTSGFLTEGRKGEGWCRGYR